MSGLAHVLEEAGIATVIVALVRVHAEKMRPPRTLWVPFELGRPLGAAFDEAQQMRTLRAALALFDSVEQPGAIVDFEEQQADAQDDPTWRPPAIDSADIDAEIGALTPAYNAARERRQRTTVGVSGFDAPRAAAFLEAMRADPNTPSPTQGQGTASVMRHASDDLKAFYFEAATDENSRPSSEQLGAWFWQHTHAGRLIRKVRLAGMAADDETLRSVAASSLVQLEWAERLD